MRGLPYSLPICWAPLLLARATGAELGWEDALAGAVSSLHPWQQGVSQDATAALEHLCFAMLLPLLSFAFCLETVQLGQPWLSPGLRAFRGSKDSRADGRPAHLRFGSCSLFNETEEQLQVVSGL